jgi:hypothetical protein
MMARTASRAMAGSIVPDRVVPFLVYWWSLKLEGGNCIMEVMAFICVVGLCSILCVVGVCSIHWQVGRIQETVNQILENQNAGADTDASGPE